jgi:hypothetical protein
LTIANRTLPLINFSAPNIKPDPKSTESIAGNIFAPRAPYQPCVTFLYRAQTLNGDQSAWANCGSGFG